MNNEMQSNFFAAIDRMDKSQRVALKRARGKTVHEVDLNTLSAFYQVLPAGVSATEENRWFFAACVHAGYDVGTKVSPIEKIIARYWQQKDTTESFRKNVITLLDMKWDDEGFFAKKLSPFITLLNQKGNAVDANSLLTSLLRWNSDSKFEQKIWIKAFNNFNNNKNNNQED